MSSKNKKADIIRHGRCPPQMLPLTVIDGSKFNPFYFNSLLLMRQNERKCQIVLLEKYKRWKWEIWAEVLICKSEYNKA